MTPSCKGVGSRERGYRELQGGVGCWADPELLCAASGLGRLPGPFQAGHHFTLQGPPGSVLGAAPLPAPPLRPLYSPIPLPSCLPNPFTSQLGFPGPAALSPGSSSPFPCSLTLSLSQLWTGPHLPLVREGWECRDFRLSQATCVPFTS